MIDGKKYGYIKPPVGMVLPNHVNHGIFSREPTYPQKMAF